MAFASAGASAPRNGFARWLLGSIMRPARSTLEIDRTRSAIAGVARLSDNIIGFGRVGIGLDGLLAWVPVVGDIYSIGAGVVLLLLGLRARAPLSALLGAGALIAMR